MNTFYSCYRCFCSMCLRNPRLAYHRQSKDPICRARPAFIFILACLNTSCTPASDITKTLENYRYRLSNVFALKENSLESQQVHTYPDRRQLTQPLERKQINMLEFLRLSACDLQRHIGEKNSAMAKLQGASQHLIRDVDFIAQASDCIEARQMQNRHDALAKKLQTVLVMKTENLPLLRWNATFASSEFNDLFRFSSDMHVQLLDAVPTGLFDALRNLTHTYERLAQNDFSTIDKVWFENQLGAVMHSRHYAGQLHAVMLLFSRYLTVMNDDLNASELKKKMCPFGGTTPKARTMQRVFLTFYVGEVQPILSKINQRADSLAALLEALYAATGLSVPAYNRYWHGVWSLREGSVRSDFKRAVQEHTLFWQKMLGACGMAPVPPQLSRRY